MFWLGVVVVATFSAATAPHRSIHQRWHALLGGIIMLSAFLGLLGFGKWVSEYDPDWLSRVIQRALSAEKPASR